MRKLLIVIRFFIALLITGLFIGVLQKVYQNFGVDPNLYQVVMSIGVILLVFVIDRNKLQFLWTAEEENRVTLSRKASNLLKLSSFTLIALPIVIHIVIGS